MVFARRYLIFEDHAEKLATQTVSQPRILDDGHFEALTAEHGVVVGMYGPAHALDDHQVGFPLPHHLCQHLVQTAEGIEGVKVWVV